MKKTILVGLMIFSFKAIYSSDAFGGGKGSKVVKNSFNRDTLSNVFSYIDFEQSKALPLVNKDFNDLYRNHYKFERAFKQFLPVSFTHPDLENVNAIKVLSNGNIVTGNEAGYIIEWDVNTGAQVRVFDEHNEDREEHEGFDLFYPIKSLDVFSNGDIIYGGEDDQIRLLDKNMGEDDLTYVSGHNGIITALAILSDETFVSAALDKTIKIWRIVDEVVTEIRSLHVSHNATCLVRLSENSFAAGSSNGMVRVWNADGQEKLRSFDLTETSITALIRLEDGNIAFASRDGIVRKLNIETEIVTESLNIRNTRSRAYPNSLALLPNGNIVIGSSDKTVREWDGQYSRVFRTHIFPITQVAALPDQRILSIDKSGTVLIHSSIEILERKYERAKLLSEEEARALFESDGPGVYDALFPKRVKPITDSDAAQVASELVPAPDEIDNDDEQDGDGGGGSKEDDPNYGGGGGAGL
jgi:WD40 repeat protein